MRYGGFWLRVVAWFIDGFILIASFALVMWIIPGSGDLFLETNSVIGTEGDPEMVYETNTLGTLLLVVVWWLYEAVMTSSKHQATVGKLCVGLIVVDQHERRLGFAHATGRHFSKYISNLLLGIGFLMVAFTKYKQGLHDFVAKTYVLKKAEVREEGETP